MEKEKVIAELKERLSAIAPYPWFVTDNIHSWEQENRLEIMLKFVRENPDCNDQDIIKKDLELDGIFPDENGNYSALEIVDDEE